MFIALVFHVLCSGILLVFQVHCCSLSRPLFGHLCKFF